MAMNRTYILHIATSLKKKNSYIIKGIHYFLHLLYTEVDRLLVVLAFRYCNFADFGLMY